MPSVRNLATYKVGIIGRPNVGKSSLFNFLTRTRDAVVKDQAGVTRDVQRGFADWWGKTFEVLDTGGLTHADDEFSPLIFEQVINSLGGIDLLVVMFDAKQGMMPEDREIFRIVKESGKPFVLVLNKVDRDHEADMLKAEFFEFAEDIIHCAVEARVRTDEVVEAILDHIPDEMPEEEESIRIAIVGKPNSGKSSLANILLRSKRMLVSSKAGTTVDAIEESFDYWEHKFTLVDTAGLRRHGKRQKKQDGVEILSSYKSFGAIDRADIVYLVVDAIEGPTDQDAKIFEYINSKSKAIIMVANKVDLFPEHEEKTKEWFRKKLEYEFHFAKDIPLVFTSALTGEGKDELLRKTIKIWDKLETKIPTSALNDFFYNVVRQAPSPVYATTNVKFYYLTQTGQKPPSFIAFANHPDGVTPAYRRFLEHRIKEQWELQGVPVRVFIMKSGGR